MTDPELVAWAESILTQYGPEIARLLGVPLGSIRFVVGNLSNGVVAEAYNNRVVLDRKYFNEHKTDSGALVHEITHAAVNAMKGEGKGVPSKTEEGLADWVRYKLGLTTEGWKPSAQVLKIDKLAPQQRKSWVDNILAGTAIDIPKPGAEGPAATPSPSPSPGSPQQNPGGSGGSVGGGIGGAGAGIGGVVAGVGGSGNSPSVTPTGLTAGDIIAALSGTTGATGAGPTPPPKSEYVNYLLRQGLDPSQYMDLLQQAIDGGWNMFRFENAILKSPEYQQQQSVGYLSLLQQLQVPVSPNLQTLVDQAAQHGYSSDEFLYYLRQTPEYAQAFPGILNSDGTLKMTESQYLAQKQQYKDTAESNGLNIGDNFISWAFRHDISPTEFANRAAGVRVMKDNPIAFNQFSAVLKAQGEKVTEQGLLRFVLGLAPAQWYNTWKDAEARTSAREAGLAIGGGDLTKTVGKPGNLSEVPVISPKLIKLAEQHGFSVAQMDAGFQQVAQDFLSVVPLSRAQHMGINRKDIVEAVFGGPRQATVQKQIRGVLAAEQARQEPVAAGTSGSLQGIANTPQTQ